MLNFNLVVKFIDYIISYHIHRFNREKTIVTTTGVGAYESSHMPIFFHTKKKSDHEPIIWFYKNHLKSYKIYKLNH